MTRWIYIVTLTHIIMVWTERKMKKRCIDRLVGKYCKIVTKEPGEDRAHVIFGFVKNIDHESGLVVIESQQGVGCLNMQIIEAIKPTNKKI